MAEPRIEVLPLLRKAKDYTQVEKIKASGFYPYFRPLSSAQDTEVCIRGRKVIMLGSNSYLGLTNHPEVKEAAREAIGKYGTGCAGSRFLNGTLDIHLELEQELAALVQKEAAVLFSTGFQANLGAISALVGRGEFVVTDRADHASIVDGCRLSFGTFVRFGHNDMESLASRLGELPPEVGKLVVVDGVFSMLGDIADLPAICDVSERHGAVVMVDDAHALGVLGPRGDGTAAHFGVADRVQIIMGTFSKSFASLGGFIASDRCTIEYLKHKSRPLVFSASISPPNTAAVLAALHIMLREPERIQRLWRNTRQMTDGLRDIGFDTGTCETPIVPVHVGDMATCFRMCMRLEEEGVFVNPVVPPAVAPNESLLRVSLMATHTEGQIALALEKMQKVGRELAVI